jgi:hypothetical protein
MNSSTWISRLVLRKLMTFQLKMSTAPRRNLKPIPKLARIEKSIIQMMCPHQLSQMKKKKVMSTTQPRGFSQPTVRSSSK